MHIGNTYTHIGIDETGLGITPGTIIVSAAATTNAKLGESTALRTLKKAKDYLREAGAYHSGGKLFVENIPELPEFDALQKQGLEQFHWLRISKGRFSRQLIEHAGIAHIVQANGYTPSRTIIHIDAFYNRHEDTRRIIHEYLKEQGFPIPLGHIHVHGWGDQRVPIVNMADILAFKTCLALSERYAQDSTFGFSLPEQEIAFDEHRVDHITPEGRKLLEDVIARCKIYQK